MSKNHYKSAGVDIEKGDRLANWLKDDDRESQGDISALGGFAGFFPLTLDGYDEPVLVSGTDGVGTKLILGIENDSLDGLGQDLVAMCVNDLYTSAATPLFFLDYFATSTLDEQQFKAVLSSIKAALKVCDCKLLGGETAEMPGLYKKGEFDLAGFVVGIAERSRILTGQTIKSGDAIVQLPSSGMHSNGFSLIRKWLAEKPELKETYISKLMTPTRLYPWMPILAREFSGLRGLANITGGGISGNLCRILPEGLCAKVKKSEVRTPEWMQEFIGSFESDIWVLENTFNMGVGMCAVLDPSQCDDFCKRYQDLSGTPATVIGEIGKPSTDVETAVVFE